MRTPLRLSPLNDPTDGWPRIIDADGKLVAKIAPEMAAHADRIALAVNATARMSAEQLRAVFPRILHPVELTANGAQS